MNESTINAAYAGYFNVPLGLVIGDDSLKKQLHNEDSLHWVEYVTTKYSLSRFAVKNKPMNIVRRETMEAVKKVLETDFSKIPIYKFEPPIILKIELQTASMADAISMMPDVKRIDGVTVEMAHKDYKQICNAIDAISTLSRSVKW